MPRTIRFFEKEVKGRKFLEAHYDSVYKEFEPHPVVNGSTNEVGKSEVGSDLLSPLEPKKNTQVINSSPYRSGDTTKIIRLKFVDKPQPPVRNVYTKCSSELSIKQINAIMTILPCSMSNIEFFLFKRNVTRHEMIGLRKALHRMATYNRITFKWELK